MRVKRGKKNTVTSDPKRNQTQVTGMASYSQDHFATATDWQFKNNFDYQTRSILAAWHRDTAFLVKRISHKVIKNDKNFFKNAF